MPDETGTTTFMSNRWTNWTGYSPEDFYNDSETWQKSIHSDDRKNTVEEYIESWKNQREFISEYRVVHRETGEITYLRDHSKPMFDEKGNIIRFDGIVSNITKQKKAEQKLKESKDKYEEAYNRMIFYQDLIAHDINNKLNNITISADVLSLYENPLENTEVIKETIKTIKYQVIKGGNLVRNVRKLSHLEEENYALENVQVNKILEQSIDFTKKSFPNKKINLQIDSTDSYNFVKANELLSDVFENILNNAVKYNNSQTVEISIKIDKKLKSSMKYIKIEFRDNGIGIPDTRKPLIFQKGLIKEKFAKGMGLGLSLLKKIIQSYNGVIKVKDRIQGDYTKGSRFIIYIPEAP